MAAIAVTPVRLASLMSEALVLSHGRLAYRAMIRASAA